MRILIADDNPLVRKGVRRILSSQLNHEVCGEASDGTEVLRLAHMLLPDLVLLDVSMPGSGGLQVARILRRELPHVKIVIVSRMTRATCRPTSSKLGPTGASTKAVSIRIWLRQ